jgi:hypothetical protein
MAMGTAMRCLECGTEMVATESEPYEGLSEIAYYTLCCPSCGDTERRLLPLGRVLVAEVVSTNGTVATSSTTPQEKLSPTEHREAALRAKSPLSRRRWMRVNEMMKNPRNFIESLVREPDQSG